MPLINVSWIILAIFVLHYLSPGYWYCSHESFYWHMDTFYDFLMAPLHSTITDFNKTSQVRRQLGHWSQSVSVVQLYKVSPDGIIHLFFLSSLVQHPQSAQQKSCGLNCGSLFMSVAQDTFNDHIFQKFIHFFSPNSNSTNQSRLCIISPYRDLMLSKRLHLHAKQLNTKLL